MAEPIVTELKRERGPVPFWWPDQRGWIVLGLFALTGGILAVSAPHNGQQPSEFFKAIAQAVVLTGFLAAVGFFFQASKGASDANDRADRALTIATSVSPPKEGGT